MSLDTTKWNGNVAGGGQGGPKLHAYSTPDPLGTAAGSGYFNGVADEVDTGDFVMIDSTAASGGGGKFYRMTKTGGTVTCAALS